MTEPNEQTEGETESPARRGFLTSAAMVGGLAAGYGAFAAIGGRYLYPAHPTETRWLFVTDLKSLKNGDSMVYRTPSGATVAVARMGDAGTVEDFLALSTTCPHLGCQVYWEAPKSRFFCPCHNGAFDKSGNATAGPPADAGQSLLKYPLKVEKELLFIEVPVDSVSRTDGAGHDGCLASRPPKPRA